MVKLSKIYTRGGDKGETSLGDGKRVPKHDIRVAAFGSIDETNAIVGLARHHVDAAANAALARIQNDLFDLGADLCRPEDPEKPVEALRVTAAQVERLEKELDAMNAELQPLSSFILPGGSSASSWLHLARTVARRAEREMTELANAEPVNEAALQYVNRLSDLFFVMARYLNDKGKGDVLWTPGQNRES